MKEWLLTLPPALAYKEIDDYRVATWNIQSLTNRDKHIIEILYHYQIDILGLTEVRGEFTCDTGEYIYIDQCKQRGNFGVGILLHRSLANKIILHEETPVCTIFITIIGSRNTRNTTFGLIYAKSGKLEFNELEDEWGKYEETITQVQSSVYGDMIIFGDLNARVGKAKNFREQTFLGSYLEQQRNKPGRAMLRSIKKLGFVVLNGRKPTHPHEITFKRSGCEGTLDYVLINQEAMREHYATEVLDIEITGTEDHNRVLADIAEACNKRSKLHKVPKQKYINIGLLKDAHMQNKYIEMRDKTLEENNFEGLTATMQYNKFMRIIEASAISTLGKTTRTVPVEATGAAVDRARSELNEAISRHETDLTHYKETLNRVARAEKAAKQRAMATAIAENQFDTRKRYRLLKILNDSRSKTPTIRGIRLRSGHITYNSQTVLEICHDYCADLSKAVSKPTYRIAETDEKVYIECERLPNEDAIKTALKSFKANKACGNDGIYAELMKDASPTLITKATKVIQAIWSEQDTPQALSDEKVFFLHKRRSRYLLDNYRQITLQNIFRALLCKIMDKRILAVAEFNDSQNGFRKNRRCAHNLYILQENIRTKGTDEDEYIMFLDLRNAFDTIDIDILIKMLQQAGINGTVLTLAIALYKKLSLECSTMERTQSSTKSHEVSPKAVS